MNGRRHPSTIRVVSCGWRPRLYVVVWAALICASTTAAHAASSTNYRMDQAVVGSAGGDASSTTYRATSTGAEAFVGASASINSNARAGYVPQLDNALAFAIDASSVSLSLLPGGGSASFQSTLTVRTDAAGYTLSVAQDHDLRHTDNSTVIQAAGGTVAAPAPWVEGTTEGLALTLASGTGLDSKWGINPAYRYAGIPGVATTIHSKSGYQTGGDATVVQYRVAVPSSQPAGDYTNTVTFSAVARV